MTHERQTLDPWVQASRKAHRARKSAVQATWTLAQDEREEARLDRDATAEWAVEMRALIEGTLGTAWDAYTVGVRVHWAD